MHASFAQVNSGKTRCSIPQYERLLDHQAHHYFDWCNDDQPYRLHTEPQALSIPLAAQCDELQCQWLRHIAPRAKRALSAFEHLRGESAHQRHDAVFGLALHPWLCGMPSRIQALRNLLRQLHTATDVRWTTPASILSSP